MKESSTRSTESIHIAHLLRIIGSKTNVQAITTETLQGYVNARAKRKGVEEVRLPRHDSKRTWNAFERLEPLGSTSGARRRSRSDQGADLREGPCQASVPDERPDRAPARTWRALDRRSQGSMGQPFPDHRPGAGASGPRSPHELADRGSMWHSASRPIQVLEGPRSFDPALMTSTLKPGRSRSARRNGTERAR